MKTTSVPVEGTLAIWAEPKSAWRIEQEIEAGDPNPFPFEYTLRTSKPYGAGNVKVYGEDVTLTVPAGINLLAKAVDTLNEAIADERKESSLRIASLQGQINNLLQLEFKATEEADVIDGVEVLAPESMESVVGNDPNA
jgi:hypothetical protein